MALFREIFGGQGMQTVIKTTLKLASAFARVVDSLAPIIPLIATVGAAKLVQFAAFGNLGRGRKQGGRIHKFATGGVVPGQGNSDSVPAMLTPGEFVIRKSSVQKMGAKNLQNINAKGYAEEFFFKIPKFNLGNKKEDLPSGEDEQYSDEEIQEFIRQIKLYQKLMEYCSKNPKECE